MCGTFYVDDETAREIEKAIRQADEQANFNTFTGVFPASGNHAQDIHAPGSHAPGIHTPSIHAQGSRPSARFTGDIRPSDSATVISSLHNCRMTATSQKWGFPGFQTGKLIINARAESALNKRMFRDSLLRRRLIIPASGFYEWNSAKEKVTFSPVKPTVSSSPILFLAGFYNHFEDGDRFVILTTSANDSMKEVHDRMPLTLEPWELEDWLFNSQKTEDLLHKTPALLNQKQEYMQQSLRFL